MIRALIILVIIDELMYYTPPLPPERTVKFECVAFVRGYSFVQGGLFLPDTQNLFLKTPKCAEFYKVFENTRF